MLFKLIEGSPLHRDALYLMEMLGLPMHGAIEAAVQMQAELTRNLDRQLVVHLWGGPPFGELRIARKVQHAD